MKIKDLQEELSKRDPELTIVICDKVMQMEHDDFYLEEGDEKLSLVIDE